jgi:uncharacterized membrane protein YphA (DoxX/SURF4 family)
VDIALLVARLVLATVFGAAGAAKVSGREGTRVTAAAFGGQPGLTGPGHLTRLGQLRLAASASARAVSTRARCSR